MQTKKITLLELAFELLAGFELDRRLLLDGRSTAIFPVPCGFGGRSKHNLDCRRRYVVLHMTNMCCVVLHMTDMRCVSLSFHSTHAHGRSIPLAAQISATTTLACTTR